MIGVFYDSERRAGDFRYANGALIGKGYDFETAAFCSLNLHARAQKGDVLPNGTPASGYWADVFFPGSTTGSRLWLLRNAVPNEANAQRAKTYAAEALRWMIDAGHLRAVTTDAELKREDIWLAVDLFPQTGNPKKLGPMKVT